MPATQGASAVNLVVLFGREGRRARGPPSRSDGIGGGVREVKRRDRADARRRRLCYRVGMTSRLDRITVDPDVLGGRPCIRGLRVRVKDILDMLAGGASRAEILDDFPYLEDEDIAAALEYAARQVGHRVIRPG